MNRTTRFATAVAALALPALLIAPGSANAAIEKKKSCESIGYAKAVDATSLKKAGKKVGSVHVLSNKQGSRFCAQVKNSTGKLVSLNIKTYTDFYGDDPQQNVTNISRTRSYAATFIAPRGEGNGIAGAKGSIKIGGKWYAASAFAA